jgi:enoyl-CoA hydratase/carnithine racemase
MRETSLGLVPDLTGTHPLVDAVGFSRALELCVTGRWVGADEALRLGLVASVADPGDLEVVVDDLLESLLSAPGPAVSATKRVLRHALSAGVHEQRRMERETQVRLIRDLMSG